MKKLLSLNICGFILFFTTSFLLPQKALTQENNIYELTQNISNERDSFYDLIYNLYPTVYAENGAITKVYGENEIKKITLRDSKSFGILDDKTFNYKNVELITIILNSFNELNTRLNLSNKNGFDKLKFVFIKCHFDFQKEDIEKFIMPKEGIRVFYQKVNPS